MNTQWETCQSTRQQCLLDWSDPSNTAAFSSNTCSQGNVPSYAVDVHTASDISAAFKFAEEEGVSLVIKNSGHDYLGRSSGAGTLAIRTTKLQSLSLNRQFIATNCPANSKPVLAITIGTGTPAQDVMDFADKHGVVVPMGADGTVSFAGGYTMGGGHGILVNAFGLAADRALEFEVVTPTGDRLFANACQNTDLFFALRGGGGGTFGVVVKVTTLALPHLTLPSFNASIPFTPENQRAFVSFVAEHTLELANQGWGGYSVPSFCFMAYTNPILDDSAAHASIVGVKSFIESRGGTFTYVVEPSYKRFFHDFMLPVAVGMQVTLSSRLVPTSMFESNASRANVVDAVLSMLEIVPKAEAQSIPFPFLFAHTPHLYSKSGGDDTSVHPAWRKSLWLVVHGASWSYNTTYDSVLDIYQTVSDAMKTFRAITPSASYLTETDLYEPDWQESFWGSNYDRLLEIKNKYDPRHLLDCWRCVGWLGEDDERYKCYIPAETVFGPQELVGVPSQHVFAYENGPMSRSTEL